MWACPSYSGCDSEIAFPLDAGCKRQGINDQATLFREHETVTADYGPRPSTRILTTDSLLVECYEWNSTQSARAHKVCCQYSGSLC